MTNYSYPAKSLIYNKNTNGNNTCESRVKNQESRVKNQESRIKSQESRVKNQESRNGCNMKKIH